MNPLPRSTDVTLTIAVKGIQLTDDDENDNVNIVALAKSNTDYGVISGTGTDSNP